MRLRVSFKRGFWCMNAYKYMSRLEHDPLLSPLKPHNYASINDSDELLHPGQGLSGRTSQEHGTSWITTASLIVANMLGAGVLGIPAAIKGMGWIPSIVVITVITIMSGLILGRLRGNNHHIHTYGDLAAHCAKNYSDRAAVYWRYGVQTIAYTYIIGDNVTAPPACTSAPSCSMSGCTTLGVANLADSVWLLITMAIAYPFVHIRTLSDAGILSYIGVGTIAIVNIIVIVRATYDSVKHHQAECHNSFNFINFVNGVTVIAFAYGGHVLMLDIQKEMKKPTQFNKAIWLSQSFMCANYVVVGMLGYYAYGNGVLAPITLNLPSDKLTIFTNALLFLHVTVAYLINSTVISTVICNFFWPGMMSSPNASKKALRWGIVATGVMVSCFIISILIPFFSDLMNIYSSVGIFTLSFAVPSCLLLLRKYPKLRPRFRVFSAIGARTFVDILVIVIAIGGAVLGVYTASKDIADKWDVCDYKISF